MIVRPKLELTRKGQKLVFLSLLALIFSGTTWRSEIVALSTLLFTTLMIEIFRVYRGGSRCSVEVSLREFKRRVVVGSTADVKVVFKVRNGKGLLFINDEVSEAFKIVSGRNSWMSSVRGDVEGEISYVIKPSFRGRHWVGPLKAHFEGPLKICILHVPVLGDYKHTVEAVPVFYTYTVKPVSSTKRIAAPPGGHPVRVEGSGVEFLHLRPYNPGDEYRKIAWKAMAKRPDRKPIVKVVQSEIQLNVLIVVDASESTLLGWDGVRVIDDIVECAGAILTTAYRLGDRVGILILTDKSFYVPPSRRRDMITLAIKRLETAWPSRGSLNLAYVLDTISRTLSKRTLIILISPLEVREEEVERIALGAKSLGHLLAVLIPETTSYARREVGGEGIGRIYSQLVRSEKERLRRIVLRTLISGAITVDFFNHENFVEKALEMYYALRGMTF